MSPANWSTLRSEKDNDNRRHLAPDPSQTERRNLFGRPVYVTNNLPATTVLVADFRRVVLADRAIMEVHVDPYSLTNADSTLIRTTSRHDIVTLEGDAIVTITNI